MARTTAAWVVWAVIANRVSHADARDRRRRLRAAATVGGGDGGSYLDSSASGIVEGLGENSGNGLCDSRDPSRLSRRSSPARSRCWLPACSLPVHCAPLENRRGLRCK